MRATGLPIIQEAPIVDHAPGRDQRPQDSGYSGGSAAQNSGMGIGAASIGRPIASNCRETEKITTGNGLAVLIIIREMRCPISLDKDIARGFRREDWRRVGLRCAGRRIKTANRESARGRLETFSDKLLCRFSGGRAGKRARLSTSSLVGSRRRPFPPGCKMRSSQNSRMFPRSILRRSFKRSTRS